MKRFALVFLLLTGCAHVQPKPVTVHQFQCPREFPDVHEDIQPFFERFQSVTGASVNGITAGFGHIKEPTVGVCHYSNGDNSFREITIDIDYWNNSDEFDREQLLFHELGHCAMNLGHYVGKDDEHIPNSIMYPVMHGSDEYKENRDFYLWDLKHHKGRTIWEKEPKIHKHDDEEDEDEEDNGTGDEILYIH